MFNNSNLKPFRPRSLQDRSSDPDAGDFCALLNAIYDTLQDPQQRAVYDAIAGYSRSSVNPFKDKTFARVGSGRVCRCRSR